MFQKSSIMSLKKKSKSLGHLTALGSPNFSSNPKMKKQTSHKNFNVSDRLRFLNHGYGNGNEQSHPQLQRTSAPALPPTRSTTALNLGTPMTPEGSQHAAGRGIKTTTPKKLKGLVRQKTTNSMPNPVAMGRALLAKAANPRGSNRQLDQSGVSGNGNGRSSSEATLAEVFGSKDAGLIPNKHRAFLMDTQVKYTVGLQSQERNLFLFNDLLLIAKERSSSHFKLKDQIPLSDVWLSTCISDVSEVTLDSTTSFVIGWPITNAVVTFSSSVQKTLWWEKLCELIAKERSHTPQSTSIQVNYFDQATNFEHVKSLTVGVEDTSRECVALALAALALPTGSLGPSGPSGAAAGFQLWVRTKFDEAPYPLIGHEIPLVIKLHWTRQAFNSRSQKSYDEYKAGCRCSFILRKVGQLANFDNAGSQKTKLKKVKSSIKLQNVFRRVSQGTKTNDADQAGSPSQTDSKKPGKLFGLALDDVCVNNTIPKAIESMLVHILKEGPSTVGIFRRSPNARAMRELREKLDNEEVVDFSECSVFVTAALLKDFLRSLPDCLLMCQQFGSWIQLASSFSDEKRVDPVKSFASTLPRMNGVLLQHLLYLLNKIASSSQENMMTSSNLSICVGPSVLWSNDNSLITDHSYSKHVSNVMQVLIDEYFKIYGDAVPFMFCLDKTEHPTFVKGPNASKTNNIMMHQRSQSKKLFDNSSLDSLLDAASHHYSIEQMAPNNNEAGISLTNLSQDSGLTNSDSQLYTFGEDSSEDLERHLSTSGFSDFHLPGQVPKEHVYRRFLYNGVKATDAPMLLRRTTSEESIIAPQPAKSAHSRRRKRPAAHRKGRAPAPPSGSSIVRSNSVNQVPVGGKRSAEWYRSRSTTRLNNDDGHNSSSSCSTLSDEDSTPHVSRSNSYARPEEDPFANGTYDIYLRDDHLSRNNVTITPTFNVDTPPGYEETMSRQRLLKHYNRSNSFVISSATPSPSSAKVRLTFDEANSPRKVLLQAAPPLPPKTERPPLPPKQRIRLSIDDTYANSSEILRQDEDFDDFPHKQLVYPSFSAAGARIHVSHVPSPTSHTSGLSGHAKLASSHVSHVSPGHIADSIRSAPQLPPKESRSSEIKVVNGGRKKQSVTKIVSASTQTRSTRNAETQTDETDFYLMYQDEHGNWHEEEIEEEESNRSLSPEYFPSFNRNMVFDNPEYLQLSSGVRGVSSSTAGAPLFERPVSAQTVEMRQAGRRKLEPVQSAPVAAKKAGVDPVIQGEINWSVSQLRTLFNQGQLSPAGGDGSSSSTNSSGHNSSTSSTYNSRFTNGEYIESSKPNKAARQVLRERKQKDAFKGSEMSRGEMPHSHHGYSNCDIVNDADSDQESYV